MTYNHVDKASFPLYDFGRRITGGPKKEYTKIQPMEANNCQVLPALTKVSFLIARYLDAENLYTQFLTPSESQIFKDAVTNFDKWRVFITATNGLDTANIAAADGAEQKDSNGKQMSDDQVAAFRVRAMIFDQLVPQLYLCSKPCCSHSNTVRDIVQGFSDDQFEKIIEASDSSTQNQPQVEEHIEPQADPSATTNETDIPPGTPLLTMVAHPS